MNSIPVTFNEHQFKRTVLGGTVRSEEKLPLSVILLNRNGSTFRTSNLENLDHFGFRKIVCIENTAVNYNLEDISKRYPHVKFIVPYEELSPGDMINLGMTEVPDGEVLVIWDTVSISSKLLTKNVVARLAEEETFCRVPLIAGTRLDLLPMHMVPKVVKGSLSVDAQLSAPDGCPTFYPFDYIGIYNRQKFILSGGFDYTIKSPFWQNLDLAMRIWLWGEEIRIVPQIRVRYETDVPVEDCTPDSSQLRFFLKNIAPKFSRDHSYIPKVKFLSYFFRSGNSFADSLAEFKEARRWVEKNKFRFRMDASSLIDNWERGAE
ncbi:MAG: hypothetical protein K5930_00100 [Treponemataceae bacterium]|nr:hypothetical protein [Treponemataceae bacterium]